MKALVALAFSLLLVVSCAGEVKKPTEDALVTREAITILKRLGESYGRRDFGAMRGFCTEDGYAAVRGGIREFKAARLAITPTWAEIRPDGNVVISVSWKGAWTTDKGVQELEGLSEFRFKVKPVLLDWIAKDSPFAQP